MNPFKMAKVFNGVPKWQIFAESGPTADHAKREIFCNLFFQYNKVAKE